MTTVIGLTGGIGSGKSTVAQHLVELGAVAIDADKVGHEAFKAGQPLFAAVVSAFGKGVVGPDGEIDRQKLGAIVFNDTAARTRLNDIMWTAIREIVRGQIEAYRAQDAKAVVLEAFGLIEAGWTSLVDQVWVTVAPERAVVERLKKGRHLDEADVLARIRSQMSNEERQGHADVVIHNEGGPAELQAAVRLAWEKLFPRAFWTLQVPEKEGNRIPIDKCTAR